MIEVVIPSGCDWVDIKVRTNSGEWIQIRRLPKGRDAV